MKKTFLSLGECLIEHREHDDGLFFAGDTFNTALYVARYAGNDLTVQYATAIGSDAISEQMTQQWLAEGINVSAVAAIHDRSVGHYWITTNQDGDRRFSYEREHSAARVMLSDKVASQQLILALDHADMIYLSGITLAILDEAGRELLFEKLQLARLRGAQVVLDNNYRAPLWLDKVSCYQCLHQFEQTVSLMLYSLDDARAIASNDDLCAETIIERGLSNGCQCIVVKAGLDGYWIAEPKQAQHYSVKPVDQVVDTTAAGDAFNAGFLYGYTQNEPLTVCGEWGCDLAAQVVQYPGAIIPHEAMPVLIH